MEKRRCYIYQKTFIEYNKASFIHNNQWYSSCPIRAPFWQTWHPSHYKIVGLGTASTVQSFFSLANAIHFFSSLTYGCVEWASSRSLIFSFYILIPCKLGGPKISNSSLELLEILVCFQFFYRTWSLDMMDQHPIFRSLACNWRKSFHFWINRVKTYFLYSFISVKI